MVMGTENGLEQDLMETHREINTILKQLRKNRRAQREQVQRLNKLIKELLEAVAADEDRQRQQMLVSKADRGRIKRLRTRSVRLLWAAFGRRSVPSTGVQTLTVEKPRAGHRGIAEIARALKQSHDDHRSTSREYWALLEELKDAVAAQRKLLRTASGFPRITRGPSPPERLAQALSRNGNISAASVKASISQVIDDMNPKQISHLPMLAHEVTKLGLEADVASVALETILTKLEELAGSQIPEDGAAHIANQIFDQFAAGASSAGTLAVRM